MKFLIAFNLLFPEFFNQNFLTLLRDSMAENLASFTKFKPYIAAKDIIPEFTPKAILLGAIFGIIFGAATVYLGLKVGLTVSASIPIAVLAIAVFKKIGNSTILENNIVQTIGSAGESVAVAEGLGAFGDFLALIAFAVLGFILYKFAMSKQEKI